MLIAVCAAAWPSMPDVAAAEISNPWRISKAAGFPRWLDVGGTHRIRYETLDGQFRAGRTGGDQMLALRTTLRVDFKHDWLGATAEMMDSRQELADTGTPIDTSMVNTLELIQAYGSLRLDGPFLDESKSEIRLGRQTLDLGSRRLVARNSYRNTVNAFTGAHWEWRAKEGPTIQGFYFLPQNRLPSDAASLLENRTRYDEEWFDLQFWGLHSQWGGLPLGGVGEAYYFGLNERDAVGFATRDRNLHTPGLRFYRPRAKGRWDWDFESAAQFGSARGSAAAADTDDLDHLAHFHHAELGRTFEAPWSPRLAALFDYASGDESGADGRSNRFDTLFGARRFDHGPTGVYGAFARSNIESPGVSLGVRPVGGVELELKHRLYWLASKKDAWTASGLRDAAGRSGSFVGHQLEASARWDLLPGNLRLEIGGAHLFAGGFIDRAPNATGQGDSTFAYASMELRF